MDLITSMTKKLMELEFLSNFHKERNDCRDFIRHTQHETEKKCLVSISQDRKLNQTRCNNAMYCDVQ